MAGVRTSKQFGEYLKQMVPAGECIQSILFGIWRIGEENTNDIIDRFRVLLQIIASAKKKYNPHTHLVPSIIVIVETVN